MIIRDARRADVPSIVALLADDPLAKDREGARMEDYLAAFDEIEANLRAQLIVVEAESAVIGCCQLTMLSGLSRGGARRALIEAVRIAPEMRSQGIGAQLMAECEIRARNAGARTLQLTTDKSRKRAHQFYETLGYAPSHLGFKKVL